MVNHLARPSARCHARVALLIAAFLLAAPGSGVAADAVPFRIGYQKFNTLNLLKARGTLEARLRGQAVRVQWLQFGTGPLLFEALNARSLDFGHAADAPTAFAQAAGVPFVYIAAEPPYPHGLAVLAPADTPLRSVADLKGKRVAIGHGWNCEYQLVRALEEAGLSYAAIKPVYVKTAADARAILQAKGADAVGLWDPFYALVEMEDHPQVLRDGDGLTPNYTFLVASPEFAHDHPELVRALLEELGKVDDWANAHPDEVAAALAKDLGISEAALAVATRRRHYGVQAVDQKVVRDQQRLADEFTEIGELPRQIDVGAAVSDQRLWWGASGR